MATITTDVLIQSGGGGGRTHEHTQSLASDTWTISHGLGYRPSVSVDLGDGERKSANVTHTSGTQVVIKFSSPVAGKAYLS